MQKRKSLASQKKRVGTMKKIIILHGWTYTTDKWQKCITYMKSAGFDPVLLHIPGLTEKTNTVWTLNDYVQWLKKKLRKEEKEKAIIVGHSNGGRIAISFAAKYPEKLKRLILLNSAGIYHNELPIRLKRFFFRIIAKLGKKITSSARLKNVLYKAAGESDYKNATPRMKQTMIHLISGDLTSQLSKITTPTLIIWGERDTYTPLSDGRRMHNLIKNSQLYIVKGAKHSPQFTHAEEVCKRILDEGKNV